MAQFPNPVAYGSDWGSRGLLAAMRNLSGGSSRCWVALTVLLVPDSKRGFYRFVID